MGPEELVWAETEPEHSQQDCCQLMHVQSLGQWETAWATGCRRQQPKAWPACYPFSCWCGVLQIQSLNDERIQQVQQAASARELELQTEFESLSNEMMERIEQLQEEVQGLLEDKQHKASAQAVTQWQ